MPAYTRQSKNSGNQTLYKQWKSSLDCAICVDRYLQKPIHRLSTDRTEICLKPQKLGTKHQKEKGKKPIKNKLKKIAKTDVTLWPENVYYDLLLTMCLQGRTVVSRGSVKQMTHSLPLSLPSSPVLSQPIP